MFIPTTKEAPKDAVLVSHQYLVRGGFISQEGAGLYNFLPLGKMVLDRVKAVVKDELDRAGCSEVQLGFVTPIELWERSGRASKMGLEMLRLKDRKGNSFVLSPTNEEAMVELVKNRVTSYRDLPLNLYQINLKFRDEARPRFGLMRGREFLMKDGYSFHATIEDMQREFNHMELTYKRIFTRLGLDFRVVEADSGAIGGSGSKEFMILANSGEDTLVVCSECDYGANIEAAKRKSKKYDFNPLRQDGDILTQNLKTIDEVSSYLNIDSSQMVKAVAKKVIYDDKEEVVLFFIRGCDELEETKACNSVNALDLVDATDEDIQNSLLVAGYIGLVDLPVDIRVVVDSELKDSINMVCGANKENYHYANYSFVGKEFNYSDLTVVKDGDLCPHCANSLKHTKGIEAGHIFQLGDVYSKPLEANFLDENGKSKPFVMGTYGIGVSRLLAGIIEQNHDEKGCIWTEESTPFDLVIIVSNSKNQNQSSYAEFLYQDLINLGYKVLLDDRPKVRFGGKMADFELIGIKYAIIVGKDLDMDRVDIVYRKSLEKNSIPTKDIKKVVKGLL
jgi:prolyl-tRNA synthetase